MTKEEAIKRLKEARNTIQPFLYVDEAIDYAIKVLEQQPSEDCINRQAVMKHLETITMDTNPDHYECKDKWYQANGFNLCKVGIEVFIKNLPSVTPSYNSIKTELKPSEDCISREDVRKLICQSNDKYGYSDRFHEFTERCLQLPSVTPKFMDAEIQKMQELEQAEIEKAYELGKAETSQALDEIITKQIDISNNQVECQTLRWVLDVMNEKTESEK